MEKEKIKKEIIKEKVRHILQISVIILELLYLMGLNLSIYNAYSDPVADGNGHAEIALRQARELFNSQFMVYVGRDIDYNIAKQCITNINASNENKKEFYNRIIDCNLTIEELDRQKTYIIDCKYDSDGFINYITITEKGE